MFFTIDEAEDIYNHPDVVAMREQDREAKNWINALNEAGPDLPDKIDLFISENSLETKFRLLGEKPRTLLSLACQYAPLSIVKYLIEGHHADISAEELPLSERPEIASYLQEHGATTTPSKM